MSVRSAFASRQFWIETIDRAVKTAAQDILKWLIAGQVFTVIGLDWREALGIAAFGAVLSVLTSLASGAVGDNTPTLLRLGGSN